ncbi:hypothetical protein ABPG72_007633 [Tetrahymena utriculariae]
MDPKLSFKTKSKFNWDDVERLPQYDGQPTILNLKYKPEYVELMDYFRAIIKSDEISMRSFELSGFVLQQLTSNYNAYHVRRKCLEQLKLSYEDELKFITQVIEGNPKTYQSWEHRRYVIEVLNRCDGEIDFLEEYVFSEDNKNYHGWGYRIWLCQKFNLFEDEWQRIQYYFEEDIRNNSAWNYRHFLLSQRILKDKNDFKQELQFIFESINKAPENEASWNYLIGWFKTFEFKSLQNEKQQPGELNIFNQKWVFKFSEFPEVQEFQTELLKKSNLNRYLLNLRIQIILTSEHPSEQDLKEALDICQLQASEVDRIRYNYWNWFKENIQKDFNIEA